MELSTTIIKTEYNSICRVCLVPSEDINLIDVKMFEYCTGINLSENSTHSTEICLKCDKSLKDFSSFKIKCIESHESLIKMYSENKNQQVFEVWLDDANIDTKLFQENITDLNEENQINKEETLDETDEPIEDDQETSSSNEETTTQITIKKNEKFDLCMYCGKSYSRRSIYSHIQKVHVEALLTERHKCDQCEKTYKKKEALMRHQRFHNNLKPYACNSCDETFLYWSARRDHMVYAHDAPYKYNCTICDYKTQQSHSFARHKNQHTGELPFKCKECQKPFIDRGQLRRHLITHVTEKNVICEICSKAFASKSYLKTHMRTHNQERNYICPVESCGKSFIQNHVLKSHMRSTHPEVEIPASGTIVSQKKDSKARKSHLEQKLNKNY